MPRLSRRFWRRTYSSVHTIRLSSTPARSSQLLTPGIGEAAYGTSKGANGQLLINLAAAGIDAKTVDAVIISHYHADHLNGVLKADNSLAFPNAEILVPAPEHKYWMDDGEMSRASTPRIQGLFKNVRRVMQGEVLKRLRTYEWGQEVIPGVTAIGTPGHSPGHTCHIIASGMSKVYVQGDLTNTPFLFVRNPGWHAFFDHDPVRRKPHAARPTTCWWPRRCWYRPFIIRSRRLHMWKRPQKATARSGPLESDNLI